ncbi:MAG: TetR family transcriptional regulator [Alphaproteobacteria bacterium]
MAKKKVTKEDLVLCALALSEQLGWAHVRMRDVAEEAGVSLSELREYFDDKFDVLAAFGRMIDRRVLENVEEDFESSARERLFDILMDRYEILNEYRPAILSVLQSFKYDPKQALLSCPYLCKSMNWMLEAAGIDTGGIKGAVKVAGLSGVYLKTLKVWAEDESADLARVMAALDKDLGRVESAASSFGF